MSRSSLFQERFLHTILLLNRTVICCVVLSHLSLKVFYLYYIRVITKLPNSEQPYKGKVKTHKYIKKKISQQPENCENRNDPDLVQAFLKKWWIESDFKAPNLPLSLRLKGSAVTIAVFITILEQNM